MIKGNYHEKGAGKLIAFRPTKRMREYLEGLKRETGAPLAQYIRDAVLHMMRDNGAAK